MSTNPNTWYHRRVAESAAKACWICYKPSTSVLIKPDDSDFFYICSGHLTDRGFCTPDAAEAAAVEERKKKADMDREIEAVKKEFEEKKRKKEEKRKNKKKDDKNKEEKKEEEKKEDEQDEKDMEGKIKAIEGKGKEAPTEQGPRIFQLQKSFYQMRLDRKKNAELAKRNRERLSNPSAFPAAPTGGL